MTAVSTYQKQAATRTQTAPQDSCIITHGVGGTPLRGGVKPSHFDSHWRGAGALSAAQLISSTSWLAYLD